MKNLDTFKTLNIENLTKLQTNYQIIYKIKKDIENDILSTDIIRYMAPYFYVIRNNKNNNDDNITYFIDKN